MQIRQDLLHASGGASLLASAFILLPGTLEAQSYDPTEGLLEDYLAERTVLIRMSCQPAVEAGTDLDIGLISVPPQVSWGTGVFIRRDGYVVTTHHTLAELIEKKQNRTSNGIDYTTSCDPDQVTIGFFRTDDLARAAGPGVEPTLPEDSILTRDETRAVADVLFVKANTFGDNRLPFICAHEQYQTDAVFADLHIFVRQIEIHAGGQVELRFRGGQGSSDYGSGRASNFLLMEIPAQPGSSGAAAVDDDGLIVGLVHGYSSHINPSGIDNYLIPYRLFDEAMKNYADPCDPPYDPPVVDVEPVVVGPDCVTVVRAESWGSSGRRFCEGADGFWYGYTERDELVGVFIEQGRDIDFTYLLDETQGLEVAIPADRGAAYQRDRPGQEWMELGVVR